MDHVTDVSSALDGDTDALKETEPPTSTDEVPEMEMEETGVVSSMPMKVYAEPLFLFSTVATIPV